MHYLRAECRIWNIFSGIIVAAMVALLVFTGVTRAQVSYRDVNYTPQTRDETIAYLHGIIAQLLVQLQARQQSAAVTYPPYNGQVRGISYTNERFDVDVGTGFFHLDGDDLTLSGSIDLEGAPYAYVWFEYGEDDDDLDERTSRRTVRDDDNFSITIDADDVDEDEVIYYRAVAESPSGHRSYGIERFLFLGGDLDRHRDRDRDDDDEPDVRTLRADDVDEDSAMLRGEVDMNDFRNGIVFFVYGEDEDLVEDIERDYDEFDDVDEEGDDLQKERVDRDLDGREEYEERVTGLDEGTEYFFQICVEYEDEDDDETIECGGVEDFETDED